MYSGDEFYGDDVTSPLERPMPEDRVVGWANACIVVCLKCYAKVGKKARIDFFPEYNPDQDCDQCGEPLA